MTRLAPEIRHALENLAARGQLSATDLTILRAFERIMEGCPEVTNGAVTVVNICTEAGISRASYYRSNKDILNAPTTRRPEVDELRTEVSQRKAAERRLRSEHAADLRELRDTAATYADQIQVLALRNAELAADNQRLRSALSDARGTVTALSAQHKGVGCLCDHHGAPAGRQATTCRPADAEASTANGARSEAGNGF